MSGFPLKINRRANVLWYSQIDYEEVTMPQTPLKERRTTRKTRQAPPLEFPEQIDASPEEIARAVINTPPKKASEWDFMKRRAKEVAGYLTSREGKHERL